MAATLRTVSSRISSIGTYKATSPRNRSQHLSADVGDALYCPPFTTTARQSLVKPPAQLSSLCLRPIERLERGRISVVRKNGKICAAAGGVASPMDKGKEPGGAWLKKLTGAHSPPASDIMWAALGAFAGMAALSYLDQHLVQRGLTPLTVGPTAAIAAILTASPKAPVAARWNIFVAHIGAAAAGVAAIALLGPGWLARAVAVAASVAFMQFTGSLHPPASGLALLFVDSAKHQSLGWRYVVFPGLAAALVLILVTEAVALLRRSFS